VLRIDAENPDRIPRPTERIPFRRPTVPHARNHKKVIPANAPLPDPVPTQKTLVEQKSDFTAEGAPSPEPPKPMRIPAAKPPAMGARK
jgi:hypothetical protein